MAAWKIAGVQMGCQLGDRAHNLEQLRAHLATAAAAGARLVVFPECVLTGYFFDSKAEAWPHAEPIPGHCTDALATVCARLGVWAVVGMLERAPHDHLFNACVLVGPNGVAATYRKIHLPCLGVDRFTTPGDRPFAFHDLGGLRLGMNICYDGSFPEFSRVLMLLGADLIVLPTNWPTGAVSTVKYLVQPRALENRVYYAAVNRIGSERDFHFLGMSRIVDFNGELLAHCDDDRPTILYADIDPEQTRNKRIVKVPDKYELDRLLHRRPEMYGPIGALPHPTS